MLDRKERRKLERRFTKAERRGKMKYIKYDPTFSAADGQPFMVPDPDVHVQKRARDKARAEGKERYDLPTIEADFSKAMIWFTNNLPHELAVDGESPRKLTPEDTGNAYAVIKAFQDPQKGYVVLEDSVYRWLVDLNKSEGPIAFRVTQAVVAERLEDLVKEEGVQESKGD